MSHVHQHVPVTVGILTYQSSIATVEATLRSALGFAEIIVCDGGSTDGTRDLALALGCKVIDQSPEFIDSRGRLINEAGVNEQVLESASFDWVFFLDHDELATAELVEEMRRVVSGDTTDGAYEIPRLYMLGGEVIECASNYPSYQIRLVNRKAVIGYGGLIHSPVLMKEGQTVGRLDGCQLVPLMPFRDLWKKWRGYMRLEEVQQMSLSAHEWRSQVLRRSLKLMKWLLWRNYKIRRECVGRRLPLRYELGRFGYEFGVIFYTGRRFVGLGRTRADEAWQ